MVGECWRQAAELSVLTLGVKDCGAGGNYIVMDGTQQVMEE